MEIILLQSQRLRFGNVWKHVVIWQCLEACLIVTTVGRGVPGRIEAGDAARHPAMHRTSLPNKE